MFTSAELEVSTTYNLHELKDARTRHEQSHAKKGNVACARQGGGGEGLGEGYEEGGDEEAKRKQRTSM